MERNIRIMAIRILSMALIFFAFGCSQQPDAEMCARYYRHVVSVSQSGPLVLKAVMQTASAKTKIIEYCLLQPQYQITCAMESNSLAEIRQCESMSEPTFIDSLPNISKFKDSKYSF